MNLSKENFIEFILENKVLTWGEFTLKSGRISPYFFNAGLFYQGNALLRLGEFYAATLIKHKVRIEHLFGPAYKGLPLATATAIALAHQGYDVDVTFNRKEIKKHGEGGQLMGASLDKKNPIMIDDVITAGTAFRESKALIEHSGGKLSSVIIALDRQERGLDNTSAIEDIQAEGIDVLSIITLTDLITYLEKHDEHELLDRMKSYQKQYGVI
ncbi:MAG: orotate phosphoribosyltransferase [Legionellaceae bacterium]|nr:orotate phosphoribosyltransferase [Legionellaceae bacterium]